MSTPNGRFLVQFAGSTEQIVSLDGSTLIIGREPPVGDLRLEHPLVSRRHAEIRREGERVTVTDLGSRNGTIVSERRLTPNEPHPLRDGDVVQIGPYTLIYQATPADLPSPTRPVESARVAGEVTADGLGVADLAPLAAREPRPAPPPPGPVSTYLQDMPVLYQDDDFLGRFLLGFEWVWEGLEQRQIHLAHYFEPATCPAAMVPWLASWFAAPYDPRWPEGLARRVLAEAMSLMDRRGTPGGLTRLLELATGRTPYLIEDPAEPFVVHLIVAAPEEERALIEHLIDGAKPAHVGYTLELRP